MLLILPAPSGIISRSSGADVADVFSTDLWEGTGASNSITNGVDLSNEGGMTWIKQRGTSSASHMLFDTGRGATKHISSNTTGGEVTTADTLTSFNSDGFTLGADASQQSVNRGGGGYTYAGWSFRKAPKFFDVVTYTGDGVAGRTVAHNLGSVPGCIIVKRLDSFEGWTVYHTSLGAGYRLSLNATFGAQSEPTTPHQTWYDTPTDSIFYVGSTNRNNGSGSTYVAYLFAHDTDTNGLIQCGSYTGNGSASGPSINLGWAPQFLIVKNAGTSWPWSMWDTARGTDSSSLLPDSTSAENSYVGAGDYFDFTATGFDLKSSLGFVNGNSQEHVYIAIKAE